MTGKREGWFKTIKRRNSYTYALGQTYNTDRVRFFRMFDAYEVMTMMVTFSLYCICRVMMNPFLELYTAGVNDISYVDRYLPWLFAVFYLLHNGRTLYIPRE